MAKQTKTEQLDAFKDFTDEQLDQVAKFIIGRDFEEGLTREDKLKELIAAKRKDTTVAKSVAVVNGQEIECPKGFAVVTIHPKNGSEWGEKSREVYFAHIHGETLVAQRGVPTRIKEKFYHQLKNSTWEERTQSTQADPARGADEQCAPDPRLEVFHRGRHRRLRDVEHVGGRRDRPLGGDLDEVPQLLQRESTGALCHRPTFP